MLRRRGTSRGSKTLYIKSTRRYRMYQHAGSSAMFRVNKSIAVTDVALGESYFLKFPNSPHSRLFRNFAGACTFNSSKGFGVATVSGRSTPQPCHQRK